MNPARSILVGAASLGLLWSVAAAAPPTGAPPNLRFEAVPVGDYTVEPSHTRILFSLSHLGLTTWYGDFSGASGAAKIDPAHPSASSVEISIPTDSVSTTNTVLDAELKGDKWLDAARFPTITFKSRKLKVLGPNRGEILGDLTFHGVTRPVTLQVRFNGSGKVVPQIPYTAGFEAVARIKRSDFGVSSYVPLVGDDVTVNISAAFTRNPG
jgi:polyisoprenoid-binding protein YceI